MVVGVARVEALQVEAGKFDAKFVGHAISGGSSQNRLSDAQSDGEARNGGNQANQARHEERREETIDTRSGRITRSVVVVARA